METAGASATSEDWKARLAGTGRWALLGAAPPLLGWWAMEWLTARGLLAEVAWTVGPILLSNVFLGLGLMYTGALGVGLWHAGQAGWRAAGFAILAMPCLNLGLIAGIMLFTTKGGLPGRLDGFFVWGGALLAAGLWTTLAGALLLPVLRGRRAVVLLLAASAGFAALAGAAAFADFGAMLRAGRYVLAAWCALHAAAVSLALPLPPRAGDDPDRPAAAPPGV